MNRNILGIDDDVETLFCKYSWPGNVRELKNIIEGAFNIADSKIIQLKDLPEYLTRTVYEQTDEESNHGASINLDFTNPSFSLKTIVQDFEKQIIEKAIEESGSYTLAAKNLRITKQALNYKLNKYNIEKE